MSERLSDVWLAEYEAACHQGDESSKDSLYLLAAARKLRGALQKYARHDNWGPLDWVEPYRLFYLDGHGWEIAEAALKGDACA